MKQKLTKIAPYLGMVVSATLVTTLTYGVIMIVLAVVSGNYFLAI
tara:strand:- start:356 stop:490 length:135 start_codon:yes stop_codon:yes gene_type:complete